jgi:hypothetical protein
MQTVFHKKTWKLSLISSSFLFLTLIFFLLSQEKLAVASKDLSKISSTERQLRQLKEDLNVYEEALGKLEVKPGSVPQREPVNFTAVFAQEQLDMLREILVSTYEFDGFFYLKSFKLEEKESKKKGAPPIFSITLEGEKVVVFWNK